VSAAGALAAVARAASLAKGDALRCRALIQWFRSRACDRSAFAKRVLRTALAGGSLGHFECAALTSFDAGWQDETEYDDAQAAMMETELAAAHEERCRWEALRRGLERRIARRERAHACLD